MTPDAALDFPFAIDARGRAATTDPDDHLRDLIRLVLFTAPGERVNRPDFGCGLLSTLFVSLSTEELTAVEFLVKSSLQRWLGSLIQVAGVEVTVPEQSTLRVTVKYQLLASRQSQTATFDYRRTD